MALILDNWNEWSECTESCGGCGMQNRTLMLLNGMHIVHVRHCNTKPCMNEEEPCCEPFKFINEKCLVVGEIQNDRSKFNNDSQNEADEAIVAWENIKGDDKQFDDSQEQRKEAVNAWDSIRGMRFPLKKSNNVNSTDLNDIRDSDDYVVIEGSGEFDNEMDSKTNNTKIIKNMDASHGTTRASKRRKISKGYNRKNYKQRQRRYRQNLPRVASKSQNTEKSEKSQKMFDSIYIYDYYDYYYYY
ncbi:hypothetical protein ACH3XW_25565 [Acanthocheilonema viteae]|uniref:Spondin-like TSP1 domain-containing protein n=1 Tax=Acanthocheilonema viteae TaxID=6277 RepID=A0A498SIR3_ACAVI|nr:unnamed protein product [Acanthocheilonema viteae]